MYSQNEFDSYTNTSWGKEYVARGYQAAKNGLSRTCNPYTAPGYPKREYAWFKGYDDYKNQQLVSGTITADKMDISNMTTVTRLFETADGKFVTKLATNSLGQVVVEERGTGNVFAVDPASLKKVVPYTVEIHTVGSPMHTTPFLSAADQVKVGDLLVNSKSGTIVVVGKINSENEHASTELKSVYRRIATEELK